MEWQHKNEASVHTTAKEFAVDRKHIREWCQCYSTLKGKTKGVLGKHLRRGQPLSVDLDQKVFEFLEDERSKGRLVSTSFYWSVIIFLCQHQG